jgi:hypothetical protein
MTTTKFQTTPCAKYIGQKRVAAARIIGIDYHKGMLKVYVHGEHFDIDVGVLYVRKHKPHVGGYYVIAENSKESFITSNAFEANFSEESAV